MKKYIKMLQYEMKTLLKDAMSLFFLAFPLIMIFLLGILLPLILKRVEASSNVNTLVMLISLMVAMAIGGFVGGALLGFSFIENKDENTVMNISVTPLSIEGYTRFKMIYFTILSLFSNLILIYGIKAVAYHDYVVEIPGQTIYLLSNIGGLKVFSYALLMSMIVPLMSLVMVLTSSNKIEGFTIMKSFGFIAMVPLLTLIPYFQGMKQYFLGIIPSFWPMKAMMNELTSQLNYLSEDNLSFYGYLLIGLIFINVINVVLFYVYKKKIHSI